MYFRLLCHHGITLPALTLCLTVSAETIHLRDGGTVNGTIVSQDSQSVRVDIGFGVTEVDRKEIASIERAGATSPSDPLKAGSDSVPARLTVCADSLRELSAVRAKVISWERENLRQSRAIRDLEKTVRILSDEYTRLSDSTNRMANNPNTHYYNYLIKQLNQLHAEITTTNQRLRQLRQDATGVNPHLTRYNSHLDQFRRYLAAKKARLAREGLSAADQAYLSRVSSELTEYEGDFQTTTVAAPSRRGSIVVTATVNGKRDGRFIFDTGATLMTVTADFARKLGLPLSDGAPVEVTLADGRRVPARHVVLSSVTVQDAEVRQVAAVVLDLQPAPGIDGLLGMSFLGNFYVSVDSKSGSITLKRFTK